MARAFRAVPGPLAGALRNHGRNHGSAGAAPAARPARGGHGIDRVRAIGDGLVDLTIGDDAAEADDHGAEIENNIQNQFRQGLSKGAHTMNRFDLLRFFRSP